MDAAPTDAVRSQRAAFAREFDEREAVDAARVHAARVADFVGAFDDVARAQVQALQQRLDALERVLDLAAVGEFVDAQVREKAKEAKEQQQQRPRQHEKQQQQQQQAPPTDEEDVAV